MNRQRCYADWLAEWEGDFEDVDLEAPGEVDASHVQDYGKTFLEDTKETSALEDR